MEGKNKKDDKDKERKSTKSDKGQEKADRDNKNKDKDKDKGIGCYVVKMCTMLEISRVLTHAYHTFPPMPGALVWGVVGGWW